jgi:ABC-2 type transport system permease protein
VATHPEGLVSTAAAPSTPSRRDGLQLAALSQRSLLRSLRQPGLALPAFVLPLFFLAFSMSQLSSLVRLPEFPTTRIADLVVPSALVQGALFAVVSAGIGMADDLQSGVFRRLALAPARRSALLAGAILGPAVAALLAQALSLTIGALAGARLHEGLAGVLAVVALLALIDIGFSALGVLLALRSGSAAAVQAALPFLFALLGLSSLNLPIDLIAAEWFRAVARANPTSYLVDGVRSLYVPAAAPKHALAIGFATGAGFAALAALGGWWALRFRVPRT